MGAKWGGLELKLGRDGQDEDEGEGGEEEGQGGGGGSLGASRSMMSGVESYLSLRPFRRSSIFFVTSTLNIFSWFHGLEHSILPSHFLPHP